jgi:hypothetical protein
MFESGRDGSDAQGLGQLIEAFCRVAREFDPGVRAEDAARTPGAGPGNGPVGQERAS